MYNVDRAKRHSDLTLPCVFRWNSAVENQAIDRIHRFGQTREVSISLPSLGFSRPLTDALVRST